MNYISVYRGSMGVHPQKFSPNFFNSIGRASFLDVRIFNIRQAKFYSMASFFNKDIFSRGHWYKIGAKIHEEKNKFLQKLLREAIDQNNLRLANVAIKCGAPINRRDIEAKDGHNDYHIVRAAYSRRNQIGDLLIKSGVDVNVSCEHGHTPLMVASGRENVALIESLLNAQAEVNKSDTDGITAFMEACKHGDQEITDRLLKAGADLHIVDKEGNNALIHAIKSFTCKSHFKYQLKDVSFLPFITNLIKLSKIDTANNEGNTPLMIALWKGYFEIIKLLLENNADKGIVNKCGQTAMAIAVTQKKSKEQLALRYSQIIEVLKSAQNSYLGEKSQDRRLNVEKGVYSRSKLFYAVYEGDVEKVKLCIAEGEDIDEVVLGQPLLISAAKKGYVEIVKLFIDAKANIQKKDFTGESALEITLWWEQNNKKEIDGYSEALNLLGG